MDISIWCLIATFLLIYAPRLPAIRGALRQEGHIDIAHPRLQQARLTGRAARAQAAHLNTVEAFAPFAAAVLLAHVAGASTALVDTLAVVFVASRAVYVPCYIAGLSALRSLVWTVGFAATLGLFAAPLL